MTKQEEIVDLMIANELKLKELYEIYEEMFPELDYFWKIIANDESQHADWLRHLFSLVEGGAVYFEEERFNVKALYTFQEAVIKSMENSKGKRPTKIEALSDAASFETALIERDYFKVFDSDALELKKTLKNLLDGSIIHLKYVKNKLKEEKENTKAPKET